MTNILTQNNVTIMGNGRPIIFVHGFGCDQNMWRFIVPAFEQEYKIILLDLVGAGDSDPTAYNEHKYATLHGHAEDIVEICEFLNLKDVIFVGHSVSAMIGILADIQNPGIFSKLVLIGPSPCYINKEEYFGGFEQEDIKGLLEMMESNYLGWSASLAPGIMGNSNQPELQEELTQSFCKTDATIAKHFARVTFLSDNRKDLSNVYGECLVLQCREDIIAPEAVGKYVHQNIPKSQYILMKATGHCPHMSAPKETIDYIQSFLK